MNDRICRNCQHFKINANDLKTGSCHLNAPQAFMCPSPGPGGTINVNFLGAFPPVKGEDFCGQFASKAGL